MAIIYFIFNGTSGGRDSTRKVPTSRVGAGDRAVWDVFFGLPSRYLRSGRINPGLCYQPGSPLGSDPQAGYYR